MLIFIHALLLPKRKKEPILGTFKPESPKPSDVNKHSVLKRLTSLDIWLIGHEDGERVKINIVRGLSIEDSFNW
jgi:hypothetical protein